jgi:hypothetical protein
LRRCGRVDRVEMSSIGTLCYSTLFCNTVRLAIETNLQLV